LLIFIIVISILGIFVEYYSYNIVKDNSYSYLYSSARARAEHILTFLDDQKEIGAILAAASVYRDFLKEPSNSPGFPLIKNKIDKRLERTLATNPYIFEAFILDKNGKIVASSNKAEEGKNKLENLYFVNAKEQVYIKDIYFSNSINKYTYSVSAPVKDDDGSFLGISVIRYDPKNLFITVSNENGLGDTEENFIINKNKYFVTPSRFLGDSVILNKIVDTENSRSCFNQEEIEYIKKNGYKGFKQFLGSKFIIENKDYRGIDVVSTHAYIPETGWCLITKVDKSQILAINYRLIYLYFIISLFSIIIFLILSYYISKRITKPIKILNEGVNLIESGNLDYKINIKSKDEIGILSESFNNMTASIKNTRADIDKKVKEQTKDIIKKTNELENQQKAILNVLDDLEASKKIIEEEKSKDEALLFNIGEGVIFIGLDRKILYANIESERLLGWKINEMIDSDFFVICQAIDSHGNKIPENERLLNNALNFMNKEFISNSRTDYLYIKKNKETFPVSITTSRVIMREKIIGAINIFRDITKEKEVDKAKTEFVSLASHQLRTPLTAINWYTEMLLAGDAGKLKPDQKNYLDEIYKGNQRMVDLVNSLLNVSRLELGTFIVEPQIINLIEISNNVIKELNSLITKKFIKLEKKIDNSLYKYSADPKLMYIILQNLLSNAVKYTSEKGKIFFNISKNKNEVLIKVSDNGIGIPKLEQKNIFTKLYMADNVKQTDTEGTGLGLYIVKIIVNNAGGKIWFESIENKGTTFFIRLPLSGMQKKEGTKSLDIK